MGVKVVVTTTEKNYPWIGVNIHHNDLVVLFTSDGRGTILQSKNHAIGHWTTLFEMEYFTRYEGTVKLNNK